MNKDRIAGKAKDIAGRIERQTGEWTGDRKKQVEGAVKQVAGKTQNAVGKAKDAVKDLDRQEASSKPPQRVTDTPESDDEEEDLREARR